MIFKTEEEDTARWSLRIDDDGDLEILVNDIRVLFIGSSTGAVVSVSLSSKSQDVLKNLGFVLNRDKLVVDSFVLNRDKLVVDR